MPGKKYTTRGMRALKAREPQIIEGDKQLLCLRGPNTSITGIEAIRDFVSKRRIDVEIFLEKKSTWERNITIGYI